MRVGVVAPDLRLPGGVREMTLFVSRSLRNQLGASLRLVSLATARDDASSVVLHRPRTWRRPLVSRYTLGELTVDHVGAVGAELEVARYRRRRAVLDLLRDCDVLHVVCGTPAWAYTVRGFAGPLIVHFASFARHERQFDAGWSALGLWRRMMTSSVAVMERAALRRADAVIALNGTRRREAQALASPDVPVEVVHTGVDTDLFSPRSYCDDGYLLHVGRLNDARKNVPLLLRAYAAARTRVPALPRLVLAGPCPPDPVSWRLIASLGLTGCVHYVGPKAGTALADIYRGASVFVLSSNEEGQGIVVVEAMAAGLPVIATSCLGPSELVTSGVEGVLTPVGSVVDLADAIVRLDDDPALRRRMSHAARCRAVREFSLDRAGARLCGVYRAAGIMAKLADRADRHALEEASV